MFFVYVLKSVKFGKHYIGYTSGLKKRLAQHNFSSGRWSSFYKPWVLVYNEEYDKKEDAIKREHEIKKFKGGIKFKKLLNLSWDGGAVNRKRL